MARFDIYTDKHLQGVKENKTGKIFVPAKYSGFMKTTDYSFEDTTTNVIFLFNGTDFDEIDYDHTSWSDYAYSKGFFVEKNNKVSFYLFKDKKFDLVATIDDAVTQSQSFWTTFVSSDWIFYASSSNNDLRGLYDIETKAYIFKDVPYLDSVEVFEKLYPGEELYALKANINWDEIYNFLVDGKLIFNDSVECFETKRKYAFFVKEKDQQGLYDIKENKFLIPLEKHLEIGSFELNNENFFLVTKATNKTPHTIYDLDLNVVIDNITNTMKIDQFYFLEIDKRNYFYTDLKKGAFYTSSKQVEDLEIFVFKNEDEDVIETDYLFIKYKDGTGEIVDSKTKQVIDGMTVSTQQFDDICICVDSKTKKPMYFVVENKKLVRTNLKDLKKRNKYFVFDYFTPFFIFTYCILTEQEIDEILSNTSQIPMKSKKYSGYTKQHCEWMFEQLFTNNLLTPEQIAKYKNLSKQYDIKLKKKYVYDIGSMIHKYNKKEIIQLIIDNKKEALQSTLFNIWND